MIPAIKFSDNPEKTTNPGIKNVYRLYDADGMAKADILALEDEQIIENKEYFAALNDISGVSKSKLKKHLSFRRVSLEEKIDIYKIREAECMGRN